MCLSMQSTRHCAPAQVWSRGLPLPPRWVASALSSPLAPLSSAANRVRQVLDRLVEPFGGPVDVQRGACGGGLELERAERGLLAVVIRQHQCQDLEVGDEHAEIIDESAEGSAGCSVEGSVEHGLLPEREHA